MTLKRIFALLVALALFGSLGISSSTAASGPSLVAWQPWQDSQFDRAKREKRFILLDLEAVWCHWCHVMEKETYNNPKVADYIKQHYIAVKVDQDARPDISKRYEDYGWPATVVFNAEGKEIVKLRGYIPPERMMAILTNIVEDPSPIVYIDQLRDNPTEISKQPRLTDELRAELTKRFYSTHDYKLGGLNQDQKFMDRDSVELALMLAQKGDKKALEMAMQTLDGALNLIDPVWGGAYQYSTDGDWDHKHFEKIMSVQTDYLKLYANAYRITGEKRYEAAARLIYRYVNEFLTSPEGGYFTSQDADLVPGEHSEDYFKLDNPSRRALGFPRIDTHVYTRETAWMIAALAAVSQAFSVQTPLQEAI
ncbi:MAG: thioredoxin domain-containing protein, partial [Betaproteobacteria bacterium]|nr:thioredoxin domain-containing protein [Betaproteobacteria bacterium]